MRWILPLVVLSLCTSANAITGYHIGNSLTWDSSPGQLSRVSGGEISTAAYHIKSNSTLTTIINNPTVTDVAPISPYGRYTNALPSYAWDYVTMQTFPDNTQTITQDRDAMLSIINLTRSNPANSDTAFYIYTGWAYRHLQTNYAIDATITDTSKTVATRSYIDALYDRVDAATDAEVHLIPTAEVFYQLKLKIDAGQVPGMTSVYNIYRDELHGSYEVGRYIACLTTYASVTGNDPRLVDSHLFDPTHLWSDAAFDAIKQTIYDVVFSDVRTGVVPEPSIVGVLALPAAMLMRRRR